MRSRRKPNPPYFGRHWSWPKEGKYWREWAALKVVLMAGRESWTKDEEDRRRHEFHVKAIGRDKSHYDFTNDDFDDFLKECWALTKPDSLQPQIRQQEQPRIRMLFGLRKLMLEMNVSEGYVLGVAEQIENGIDPNSVDAHWQRERERSTTTRRRLDEFDIDQLKSIMSALHSIKRRGGQQSLSTVRNYTLHKA